MKKTELKGEKVRGLTNDLLLKHLYNNHYIKLFTIFVKTNET